MHDYDRTQQEWEGTYESEAENYLSMGEAETFGEVLGESFEAGLQGEAGEAASQEYERGLSAESPVGEAMEMELASEALEVTNEDELERFLGGLIRRVGKSVGRLIPSQISRPLGGLLKSAARVALPVAGRALGTALGGPVGGFLGGKAADFAGQMFGLELEGLSSEDREFEQARAFVRYATDAAKRAAVAPPGQNPQSVATSAVTAAARRHAPGLTGITAGPQGMAAMATRAGRRCQCGSRGTWLRRGHRIVLFGV